MSNPILIHLEHQNKTSRVSLQPLPEARPIPPLEIKTPTGSVYLARVTNGHNPRVDPEALTPKDLIAQDPELQIDQAGQILEPEMLSTVYYDPLEPELKPASEFKFIDVVVDPQGQEKERRPHLTRKSNLNDLQPLKIGRRLPIQQALTSFVFKHTYQLVHEDGLQREFLYGLAKELQSKQEVAILGAGSRGNQPLVVRERGNPYRGFLYGEIGTGENEGKYKLLLLLSEQELKHPDS